MARPRKKQHELLIERKTVRLTTEDLRLLEEIASHYGQAPEGLLRRYVLPTIRSEHQQLFGNDNSGLTA